MRTLRCDDGVPLHWRQWSKPGMEPARGTVLIVHGLGEHIGRYETLAARLNSWGWHVVGYDQRGHGASGGPRGDVVDGECLLRDLALVIDELRLDPQLGRSPLILLGHSMGGLVASRFVAGGLAASSGGQLPMWFRPIDALVLSSPALDPGMSGFQRLQLAIGVALAPHLAVGNGLKTKWISRDAAVVKAYIDDPLVHDRITPTLARAVVDGGELVRQHAADWVVPTLLIWAGSDKCVAPAGTAEFAANAPAALVNAHCFEPLFHEIFNEPEREQVFARLQNWLAARFG
ncbi:alpha/beta hydrolase [Roseateles oligotrophus]|uniref:Alpha/beta hydrolase n=1 Tax=Roseateles oligotrophus TaxID=1769250 RepID=A0ABT2YJT0_9BURK|nr:alpha/beta hydrolase [Roseateles oligotrophus]MCV2370305.1 alpha/beta hydrolase [Roseateles oligotrophus]